MTAKPASVVWLTNGFGKLMPQYGVATIDVNTQLSDLELSAIEYASFAYDMVILVDGFRKWEWFLKASDKRLRQEFEKVDVQVN